MGSEPAGTARLPAPRRPGVAAAFLAAALSLSPHTARSAGWTAVPGGRWQPATPPSADSNAGFKPALPDETGIRFTNHLAEATAANNRILENGSGVALGDIDGDGLCDVYFCRLEGDNVLYRNLGNWRFEDFTATAGVACPDQASTGATLADVDGDNDLDLVVNSIGNGTRLFLNDGSGRFTELTGTRLVRRFGATSMALADMDGDGDLDLYVTNYRTDTFRDDPPGLRVEATRRPDGSIAVTPEGRFIALMPRGGGVEVIERGERDFLYINTGNGRFAPVGWTTGAFADEDGNNLKDTPTDWGLAVQFRDFTGDGLPDLYVCNDFAYWPDRIWVNDGGRRFRAAPLTAFRHQSLSSMSVDVADIDRDGRDDLFVAEMMSRSAERRAWQRPNTLAGIVAFPRRDPLFRPEVTHNTLHWARDDGSFAEIAAFAGVAASEWTWSAAFLDVDLDGWEDLLLATGNFHDVQHADVLAELAQLREPKSAANRLKNLRKFGTLPGPLIAHRNRRDRTFDDASTRWGFDATGIHTGMAFGDLDNDGDLDAVLNQMNGPATVLRNEAGAPRVAVRLRGTAPNSRGVGARIKLLGGPVEQSQEMLAGGRYLSSDEPLRVFAASPSAPMRIEVTWRSGRRTVIEDVRANRLYEIDEPGPDSPVPPRPTPPRPAGLLAAQVLAAPSGSPEPDPFARQRLLPRRPARAVPPAGWISPKGDETEWLAVGGQEGSPTRWFATVGPGAAPVPGPASHGTNMPAAVTAMLTDGSPAGWLLLGPDPANPERVATTGGDAWQGLATAIPPMNPGPAAAADLDGDGSLELFIGHAGIPGQWPRPGASVLMTREQGAWKPRQSLAHAGGVTGALFTDLDADGVPELVAASLPGRIHVWRFRAGRLESATVPGLTDTTGWWTCLAAADIDADGRMDVISGNWGWNWRPEPRDPARPDARIAWADFAGANQVEPLLGTWDVASGRWVPRREWRTVGAALPWVPVAFPSHATYGRATFDEIVAGKAEGVESVEIRSAASTLWLNRGDRFEPRPLPPEAQWTTVNAIATADLDADGNPDLFLSQNEFATDDESTRQDAGTGLVLLGDGRGGFRALGPAAAGVFIPEEGRGLAVGDPDRDGRPDLAHTAHAGPLRLLRAAAGTPAIRVVRDPALAPARWIGTRLRWVKDSAAGPVIEVRAGNGSGGQDSLAPLLSGVPAGAQLEVRLPHGKPFRLPLNGPVIRVGGAR